MFIFGIHRSPKYYKNPENFNPSRFEDINSIHPFAYIPFGAGRRNCIGSYYILESKIPTKLFLGQKFAMLEMKSIISKILTNYELFPAIPKHNLKLVAETVLKSSTGARIRLKKRSL